MAEIIEDNKEYQLAAVQQETKKHEKAQIRASLTNTLSTSGQDVDDIVSAPIKIENILDEEKS